MVKILFRREAISNNYFVCLPVRYISQACYAILACSYLVSWSFLYSHIAYGSIEKNKTVLKKSRSLLMIHFPPSSVRCVAISWTSTATASTTASRSISMTRRSVQMFNILELNCLYSPLCPFIRTARSVSAYYSAENLVLRPFLFFSSL